jgi:hypothetical protein
VVVGSPGHRKAVGEPGMAASVPPSGEEVSRAGWRLSSGASPAPGCFFINSCPHLGDIWSALCYPLSSVGPVALELRLTYSLPM